MYCALMGCSGGKAQEDKLQVCYCLRDMRHINKYAYKLLMCNSWVSHKRL